MTTTAMVIDPTAGRLIVDLGAICANWKQLRDLHAPGAVAGVLKADGYGLGADQVGTALRDAGCRHFFVAHLSEGLSLRKALGAGPMIAVLNGFPAGGDGEAAGLTPVLNGPADLEAHAARARARALGRKLPVILHVDTAMRRLGLSPDELATLAADPSPLAPLDLLYVMTHLACGDVPEHPLNAEQARLFHAACDALPKAGRCFANSPGLFLGDAFRSDLARPGAALYGINPTPGRPNPMRQVFTLDAPILQVREVPAGVSVGYGASWAPSRPSRLATVAAGYADGYLRALSGKGVGLLGTQRVPLVGRVSMDLIIFDVTDAPEPKPGDRIILMGPDLPPDELAEHAGTIGYELLTGLGRRYRRSWLPN